MKERREERGVRREERGEAEMEWGFPKRGRGISKKKCPWLVRRKFWVLS